MNAAYLASAQDNAECARSKELVHPLYAQRMNPI